MDATQLKKFYLVDDNGTALYEWKSADYASKTALDSLATKVDSLTAGGLTKQVVSALPSLDDATPNVIYLVPEDGSLSGTYVEYLCFINTEGQKVLEKIGTTATDLADYLTTAAAAETYLTKTDAGNTYLNKTDAGNTYATKTALASEVTTLNNSIGDINTDLSNKLNSFTMTQAAFDTANASNSLANKSLYLISDAPVA